MSPSGGAAAATLKPHSYPIENHFGQVRAAGSRIGYPYLYSHLNTAVTARRRCVEDVRLNLQVLPQALPQSYS